MEDSSHVVDSDMAVASKLESARDGTPSSIESTPELECDAGAPLDTEQQPVAPPKRKGGRKPIYATSEERKQRNRQAQAAFRERRTEYIKQLEAQIKQNEDALATLQQNHRTAADECLMLRYKNSLLERILLEKGIDVQAELDMKTGSPIFPPGFVPPPQAGVPQIQPPQPPLQRATVNRQHARRSGQAITPKLPLGQNPTDMGFPHKSPQTAPTPSSHASSPTTLSTRSPNALQQGGMTPPTSAILAQPQGQHYMTTYPRSQPPPLNPAYYQPQHSPHHQRPPQRPTPPSQYQSSTSAMSSHSVSSQPSLNQPPPNSAGSGPTSAGAPASAYYPSPFQKHIDQLEQEYDTHTSHSMLDQPDSDPNDPPHEPLPQLQGHYPPQSGYRLPDGGHHTSYYHQQVTPHTQQQMAPQPQYEQPTSHPSMGDGESSQFGSMGQMIDPNDPMLDADPFGLSASMHYSTAYAFDAPPGR